MEKLFGKIVKGDVFFYTIQQANLIGPQSLMKLAFNWLVAYHIFLI